MPLLKSTFSSKYANVNSRNHVPYQRMPSLFSRDIRNLHNDTKCTIDALIEEAKTKKIMPLSDEFNHRQLIDTLTMFNLPKDACEFAVYKPIYSVVKSLNSDGRVYDENIIRSAAAKLSIMFGDVDEAMQFLKHLEKLNTYKSSALSLIYDLDTLNVPPANAVWNIKLWQALAKKHMTHPQFARSFLNAEKIEAYVLDNKESIQSKIQQKIRKQYEEKIIQAWHVIETSVKDVAEVDYVEQELTANKKSLYKEREALFTEEMHKKLNIAKGPLSEEQKNVIIAYKISDEATQSRNHIEATLIEKFKMNYKQEYARNIMVVRDGKNNYVESQLQSLNGIFKSNCNNAYRHILSPHTDVSTLIGYAAHAYYKNSKKNPAAAELFYKFNISQINFDIYLTLKPIDDDTYIPPVHIDGASIGHPDFHLEKLDPSKPEAGVLGDLSGCCQSIGKQGASSAIHGIISPYSGFYVLRHKKDGDIVAQCWAWRSQQDHVIIDSVESQVLYRVGKKQSIVIDFFRKLTFVLANDHNTKVYFGKSNNTPEALLGDRTFHKENFIDGYNGYRDSDILYKPSNNRQLEEIYLAQDLMAAVRRNDIDHVIACIKNGADMNAKDKHGFTPVEQAEKLGHFSLVKNLVRFGYFSFVDNNEANHETVKPSYRRRGL